MAKSFLHNPNLPKGLRNNNPGNLVLTGIDWQGKIPNAQNTDGHFEQFVELRYGIRAMMRDMINDVKSGQNTIAAFIDKYAPASDNNDTVAYIKSVAQSVGMSIYSLIDLSEETVIALCKAIATVENGAQYAAMITDQDYQQAIAILGIPLKKKVTTHS